jgi:hypothetical protein
MCAARGRRRSARDDERGRHGHVVGLVELGVLARRVGDRDDSIAGGGAEQDVAPPSSSSAER